MHGTLIMISALDDLNTLVLPPPALYSIHQAVFSRNSTGPPAREVAFERFWLAEADERCPPHVLNYFIQAFMDVRVRLRPVKVVVPPVVAKMDLQALRGGFEC
jgi:hypothetical protein